LTTSRAPRRRSESGGVAAKDLPLSTLLSQVLVAFTVEFDNEFERQMPHRTTDLGGSRHGPWLTSLVMWSNCMAFVGEEGISVGKLASLARTKTNLDGMRRWGYITYGPAGSDERRTGRPLRSWIIRATPEGRKAREVWSSLFAAIEQRWELRFGATTLEELRRSLFALTAHLDRDLPDCLPILGYGLFCQVGALAKTTSPKQSDLTLAALLSKALLAIAIEFERASALSLAMCANVLRLLAAQPDPLAVRDLPLRSGISKPGIAMALSFMAKNRLVAIQAARPGTKVASLTDKGLHAAAHYSQRLIEIDALWRERLGKPATSKLRGVLEELVRVDSEASPLFVGMAPGPENWRARIRRPLRLPHFPCVLHRGGYPDGS
jgi:hypothetical protein